MNEAMVIKKISNYMLGRNDKRDDMHEIIVTVEQKYLDKKKARWANGLPLAGDVCEWCHCGTVRITKNGTDFCKNCGAQMARPIGYIFGIPVTDAEDYKVALCSIYFQAYYDTACMARLGDL